MHCAASFVVAGHSDSSLPPPSGSHVVRARRCVRAWPAFCSFVCSACGGEAASRRAKTAATIGAVGWREGNVGGGGGYSARGADHGACATAAAAVRCFRFDVRVLFIYLFFFSYPSHPLQHIVAVPSALHVFETSAPVG